MHEMSLMSEIIRMVSNDATQRGFNKVKNIEVIVGELSNVLPDALELAFFYFRNLGEGLIDETTELSLKTEEAKAVCQLCMLEFHPDYRMATCPKCDLPQCLLISGESFRVEAYEGSEEDEN